MQLTLTGQHIEIGGALRAHVEASLGSILDRYFKTAIEAHVVLSKEAHLTRADIALHVGRGIVVNAGAAVGEAYTAFDAAAERLAKQLRRYKRRLRDHHAKAHNPRDGEPAEAWSAREPTSWRRRRRKPMRRSGRRARGHRRNQHRATPPDCRRGGNAHGSGRCAGVAVPQSLARRAEPRLSARRRQYRLDRSRARPGAARTARAGSGASGSPMAESRPWAIRRRS